MAVRQAWNPASAFSVRSTPQIRLGKTSAIERMDRLRLVEGVTRPLPCLRNGGRATGAPAELVGSHGSLVLERNVLSRRRDSLAYVYAYGGGMGACGGRQPAWLFRTRRRSTHAPGPYN